MTRFERIAALLLLGASWCAAAAGDAKQVILSVQNSIAAGDQATARLDLQKALTHWPNHAGLLNLLGILSAMDGDMAEAKRDFERSVQLDPGLAAAWKNLAKIHMGETGEEAAGKAENALQRALRIEPGDDATRLDLARLLEWRGAFAESLRETERVALHGFRQPLLSALRCADLAGLGRSNEAAAESKSLASDPGLSESDVLTALPVLERQLPSAALLLMDVLQSRHLETELSRAHLGTIYEGAGDLDRARQAYESTAAVDPRNPAPLLDLARVAYKQKDIDGALGYAAHARDLAPQNSAVHFFFGMLAVEKNLPLEAAKSLATAVHLNPENAAYNYAMGAVSLQGKDPAESLPYFRRYLELTHGDPRGRFALGVGSYYCGDYKAARSELTPLTAIPATAAGAHYFLGRIEKLDENTSAAVEHFEKSIASNPNFPDAHAELAMLKIRASEYDRAAAEIEKALALDPENASANRDLLVLYQRRRDQRAGAQAERVARIEAKREEKVNLLFRTIEVRPY